MRAGGGGREAEAKESGEGSPAGDEMKQIEMGCYKLAVYASSPNQQTWMADWEKKVHKLWWVHLGTLTRW